MPDRIENKDCGCVVRWKHNVPMPSMDVICAAHSKQSWKIFFVIAACVLVPALIIFGKFTYNYYSKPRCERLREQWNIAAVDCKD